MWESDGHQGGLFPGLRQPPEFLSTSTFSRDDNIDGIGSIFFFFFGLAHFDCGFVDGIPNPEIMVPNALVTLLDESVRPHADDVELLALSAPTSVAVLCASATFRLGIS